MSILYIIAVLLFVIWIFVGIAICECVKNIDELCKALTFIMPFAVMSIVVLVNLM